MKAKLYNLLRLSAEFKIPAGWLKTQAKKGKIPCLFIGNKMFFDFEAVEKALAGLAAKGDGND
jgi:hypothetical protein